MRHVLESLMPWQAVTWHRFNYSSFEPEPMLWHLRQTGEDDPPCAFDHVHGQSLWEYLKSKSEAEQLFSKAMVNGDLGKFSLDHPDLDLHIECCKTCLNCWQHCLELCDTPDGCLLWVIALSQGLNRCPRPAIRAFTMK